MEESKDESIVSASNVTLAEVLTALENAEDHMEQFDPEILVGTLNDKVDAVHLVIERMKATVAHLKEVAKPLTQKAKAIDNARERLREYVAFNMKAKGYDNLPGNSFKAILNHGAEKVRIESERQPNALDHAEYRRFIKTTVTFTWDEDEIEKAFLAGEELPPMIQAQKDQSIWVTFRPNVPEKLEAKKGRKKA